MQTNYEINKNTLALVPLDDKRTKVIEKDDVFFIASGVMKIIEQSCRYFGSSYLGRQVGSKNILGTSYKVPIIIEETNDIIFFPTTSPRLSNCSWISLNHLNEYHKNHLSTIIDFNNGYQLEVSISFNSFENQLLRATRLESILRKRKNC